MSKASHYLIAAAGLCGVLAVPTAVSSLGIGKVVQTVQKATATLATKPQAAPAPKLQPYTGTQPR